MLRTACFAIGALLVASSAAAQTYDQLSQSRLHTVVVPGWLGVQERVPTYIRVSTLGVDFHDRASTTAFHQRLRIVADRACDSREPDLGIRLDDRRCARIALISAVRDVNEPLLTQVAGLPSNLVVAENTR